MKNRHEDQLDALRRQLEEQNREWERLAARLRQLGDVEIPVSQEVLAELVEAGPVYTTHDVAAPVVGVRA